MNSKMLTELAVEAMQNAYTPYSNFKVGAALLTEEGKVYKGCNIENGSFGATNCAERTAIFSAVSNGEKNFKAIAVVGGKDGVISDFCPPCGICRQVMSEFCGEDFVIILTDGETVREYTLAQLLPLSFDLKG